MELQAYPFNYTVIDIFVLSLQGEVMFCPRGFFALSEF